MKRPSFLALLLLLVSGCSSSSASNDDPAQSGERICTPRAFVFCVCKGGSHGTKQCASTGRSFGPCTGCDGETLPEGCTPGDSEPCLCNDKTEGVHTCQEDGASFDACHDCGAGGPGGSGGSPQGGGADQCPGKQLAVDGGEEVTAVGTTDGSTDDFEAPCGGGAGPDVVYKIVPGATGTLTIDALGQDAMDPVLFSWDGACGVAPGECSDSSGSGSNEELTLQAQAGVPVFVVVDTNGVGGAYTLTARLDAGQQQGDSCPGDPVVVGLGAAKNLNGSTTGASGDSVGELDCAASKGSDVVYAVQTSATGQLTARLVPQGSFDGVLYVRTDDCDAGPQLACSNQAPAGGVEEVSFPATAGQIYSVFVDGAAAGTFQLSLSLSQKFCGDSVVQPGEQCDDGNPDPDDGCAPDCKVESDPPEVGCPGVEVHVFDTALLSGSTNIYANNESDPTCGGTLAPDRVYRIIPEKSGTLSAAITTASFDALLYARGGSCTGKALGCGDAIGLGGDTLDLPVTANIPVWLVVDGWDGDDKKGQKGTFALSLSIK